MARKGISPTVSYVLLLALVVISSVAAYVWGSYNISLLEDLPIAHNMESQLVSVDQAVQSVAHGDLNFTSVIELYYAKGMLQVNETGDIIKYSGQINANVYKERVTQAVDATCCADCSVIDDDDSGVVMVRLLHTNVFRGSTGDERSQFVEIVICYDDIDIVADPICVGKSGPRSKIVMRKVGYVNNKPQVMVGIC